MKSTWESSLIFVVVIVVTVVVLLLKFLLFSYFAPFKHSAIVGTLLKICLCWVAWRRKKTQFSLTLSNVFAMN